MIGLNFINPYAWAIQLRDLAYEKKWKTSEKINIPVISVGNLNVGGSGKTPFIQFLVEQIKKQEPQKKILIVSKSYKARLTEPREVLSTEVDQTRIFGDEACLLKSMLDADVWSGPVKADTLSKALESKKYDLAIVDDGFSHLKIKSDLNIVLFDVSREPDHYQLIPFGLMREPWSALKRSDIVVLTKVENQPADKVANYREKIKLYQPNIIEAEYTTVLDSKMKNIFLYTGLGHPEALIHNLKQMGFHIAYERLYPDHFDYNQQEQAKLWSDISVLNKQKNFEVASTTKDLIKINHVELKQATRAVELKVSMSSQSLKLLSEIIYAKVN